MFRKIILHSGVQIIGRGISLVFSVLLTSILSRRLGIGGYGNYILITTLANLLITTANWGTQIIGVRELSRTKDTGRLIGSLGVLRFLLSLIAIIFGIAAILFLPIFEGIRIISLITLPLVLVINFGGIFNIIFQANVRMDLKTLSQVLSQGILFSLTLLFLNQGMGLLAPLLGLLIAKLITTILAYPLSKNFISKKFSFDKVLLKKLFWASLPLGAQLTLFTAYDQAIDSFIIKNYLGANQVGLYGLAYKIYSNLVLPAYYLNSTILPMLSKKNSESKKSFLFALGLTIIGLIFLVPLTIGFSDFIIQFISGPAFSQSSQILKILAISLIFAYSNHLTGFLLIAKNRQVDSLKISLIALVWNLGLNLIFVPYFGIIAAAWVTVSTEALVSIISTWRLSKCYNRQQ